MLRQIANAIQAGDNYLLDRASVALTYIEAYISRENFLRLLVVIMEGRFIVLDISLWEKILVSFFTLLSFVSTFIIVGKRNQLKEACLGARTFIMSYYISMFIVLPLEGKSILQLDLILTVATIAFWYFLCCDRLPPKKKFDFAKYLPKPKVAYAGV